MKKIDSIVKNLFSLSLMVMPLFSDAQDVESSIKKYGIDKVASTLARKLDSTLPQKKDFVTTHTKSYYEEKNRYFYFVYKISDDGFDRAIEIELKKTGYSREYIDDTKVLVSIMEETFFRAIVKNERKSFVNYFCSHNYYRPMMRNGVVIRYVYHFKMFESEFNIGASDC